MSEFIREMEEEAREQLKEIRAARLYQGTNPDYRYRAKTAVGVIGAYVRLRATMANEEGIRLATRRLEMDVAGAGRLAE